MLVLEDLVLHQSGLHLFAWQCLHIVIKDWDNRCWSLSIESVETFLFTQLKEIVLRSDRKIKALQTMVKFKISIRKIDPTKIMRILCSLENTHSNSCFITKPEKFNFVAWYPRLLSFSLIPVHSNNPYWLVLFDWQRGPFTGVFQLVSNSVCG